MAVNEVVRNAGPEDGDSSGDGDRRGGRLRFVLRALEHRNYRLYFGGQGVSVIGRWVTRIATAWLVYRLTGSAVMLGVVGFAGRIPTFLLAPFAGVWVDRIDRYRLLLGTQTLALMQSAALAALALTGVIQIWHVIALSVFQGIVDAFDIPGRQAFLVDMVEDREALPNAIALNSTMFNAARLIGPSIAGILIAAVGEGWCFLLDAVSYMGVLIALLLMRVARKPRPEKSVRVLAELRDGFEYVFGFAPFRAALTLLAVVGLMGMPYVVLMPIIAAQTLGGGANTLGFLMAASGVGALIGAVYLAGRRTVLGLGRLVALAAAAFGIGLVGLGLSRSFPLSLAAMVVAGGGSIVQMASTNTILQTIVRDDMRGRVMAFYAMAFGGTIPIGNLLGGALAARIGAPETILLGGAACIAAALVFARRLPRLRRIVRPIYVERGILPEIAIGLRDAT